MDGHTDAAAILEREMENIGRMFSEGRSAFGALVDIIDFYRPSSMVTELLYTALCGLAYSHRG